MLNSELQHELRDLVNMSLEGEISDEQHRRLGELLDSAPEAVDYYLDIIQVHYALNSSDWRIEYNRQFSPVNGLLLELAEEERTAPTFEIPKAEPPLELIEKVVYPAPEKRSLSKLSIATFILSAAAVLFLVILARTDPNRVVMAEITKVMEADWAAGPFEPEIGDCFYKTDKPRLLKSGILEVTFGYGATVILEGPCEFSCKSEGTLYLQSGRAFASVLPEASGFTIETPVSRIVDLGTEFGVNVGPDGSSSAQVFLGKTRVIANRRNGKAMSETIEKGDARKVDARTGVIHKSSFEKTGYVRSFDPKYKNVWRGQEINLADIVGGGNGFGTGKPKQGLLLKQGFSTIESSAFVDGVFVPAEGQTAPVISTTDLKFKDCPATSGAYGSYVRNSPEETASGVYIQGTLYGGNGAASVFMHSNSGITFDLKKIREAYPHLHIQKLTTEMGLFDLPDSTLPETGKADLWVLIDGEPFNEKKRFANEGLVKVSIDIPVDARFLTLAITDGGPNEGGLRANHNDRCVFGSPLLHLVPRKENEFEY